MSVVQFHVKERRRGTTGHRIGEGYSQLARIVRIHVRNRKCVDFSAGLRIFGDFERAVALGITHDALDFRILVHVLKRDLHVGRIGKAAFSVIARRGILLAVLHHHTEGVFRSRFKVKQASIAHLHLVRIHVERDILNDGESQMAELDILRIGFIDRHFAHDFIVFDIFIRGEVPVGNDRSFVHVKHRNLLVERYGIATGNAVLILQGQSNKEYRIAICIQYRFEIRRILNANHGVCLAVALFNFCFKQVVGRNCIFFHIRKDNLQRCRKIGIDSIDIHDFVASDFRCRKRVFGHVIVVLVVVDNNGRFVLVGKCNRHRSRIGKYTIGHSHMERNLVVRKSRFVIKDGTFENPNCTGSIDLELGRRFHKAIVEGSESGICRIRIRSNDFADKRSCRRIFGNREIAILGSRLFVLVSHENRRESSISKASFGGTTVRKQEPYIEENLIFAICQQGFVIKLCAVLYSNDNPQRMVRRILHHSGFEKVFCSHAF